MRPAQSFAQEDRGADGADDGDGRGGNDRAVGQRREAVAAGLQQRKWRAAANDSEAPSAMMLPDRNPQRSRLARSAWVACAMARSVARSVPIPALFCSDRSRIVH